MGKFLALFATAFIAVALLYAVNAIPNSAGYFKSDSRYRVMAFHVQENLTLAAARKALDYASHTDGRITVAVLYEGDRPVPDQRLTLAPTFPDALDVINSPPYNRWSWRLHIDARGQRTFEGR